jgi:hypothetical protein
MPSLCNLDWSVVRFILSRAAAPFGPPITQSVSSSARRMCWRPAASSQEICAAAVGADGFNLERYSATAFYESVGRGFRSTNWR